MKKEIKCHLERRIEEKLTQIQNQINDLRSDMNSESKSTAGDKHETGRAMIQQEMENLGKQAELWSQMQMQAQQLPEKDSFKIELGSLFEMDKLWFYVSVSFGKIMFDNKEIHCLSASSPLIQAILGMGENSKFKFNNVEKSINQIL